MKRLRTCPRTISIKFCSLCAIFYFIVSLPAYALDQNEKLWTGFYMKRPLLLTNERYLYSLYAQLRLINKSQPWQTNILEGALGYVYTPDKTFWLGYRWIGSNPNNGFAQNHYLFEQLMWKWFDTNDFKFISRTRFEQVKNGRESPMSFRLRERVTYEMKAHYFNALNPVIFDEIFLQLNQTDYASHRMVEQNRFFIGFNWYLTQKNLWEIGYINQYQYHTPQQPQNRMNHVLSLTYMMN